MKFKQFLLLTFILLSTFLLQAQTTYFIKYKSSVPVNTISQKIIQQKISDVVANRQIILPDYKMDYFAKGLGRGDDVLERIVKIQFLENVDSDNFNSMLSVDPEIEYIQQANTYSVDAIPTNDSLIAQQWGLEKIKAFDAWNITQGSDTVLLAIIDTGIEYFHPDLKNKIYYNAGEMGLDNLGRDKRFNRIDDDNNGFMDDYMGWDFVDRAGFPLDTTAGDYIGWDNDPYDPVSGVAGYHGTFVGGIAGAEANNIIGISGAAPNIKILNLRAFENSGGGEEDDVAAAILYAVKMGAKVINMSFGDYSFSYVLRDVIRYAYAKNVVLIASSGNQNVNTPHYPSGYSEVISVGNSTEQDYVASNSTWGSTLDLVAPGTSIVSTTVNSSYTTAGGTSASAPFVSAAAALILSLQNFTNEEVKQIIKSTTDDIGESGWDLKSGAGRLNMERALRVLAPSIIKFNFPLMDYATNKDTLSVKATILSANFVNYKLQVGKGITPDTWTTLIQNGLNQFTEQEIYKLNISSFSEGTYTLRLLVNQNNGSPIEERVFFHIMRTPPKVIEVGLGPLYYGDRSTIAGEFYTNQLAIMKMYYRKFGETSFKFISLDGFATNNQFVKQLHYGFIPKDIVLPSSVYEIYFEAENLAGLKTTVVDSSNNNNYFRISTEDIPKIIQGTELAYSLPNGTLFPKPVSFQSANQNEILFQASYTTQDMVFGNYRLENNTFLKNISDSLINRYPKFYGDLNNNGLKDLITSNFSSVITVEQTNPASFSFSKKDSTTKLFRPVLEDNLLNNTNRYLITENEQKRYIIWKINTDLTYSVVDTFYVAKSDSFGSHLTTIQIAADDIDNDGNKEIWFLDEDANLKSYKVNSNLTFTKSDSFYTYGLLPPDQQNILSIGNYDGNGNRDIAVLYQTNSIAPAFLLAVITFENHRSKILMQKVFLNQADEYVGGLTFNKVYQSIKFVDLDNDGMDELVVNMFPYAYIFKRNGDNDDMIFFKEGSNTENVFVGDLNQNGVKEIGLKLNEKFSFFEFSNSNRAAIPGHVKGYSIDSSTIQISWTSDAPIFSIFKGTSKNNLDSIGLITERFYFDNSVQANQTYYYAIKAYDPGKTEPLSGMSEIIEVYSHTPAKPISAASNSKNSIIVKFSEKMKNTIENLQAFNIIGAGYPNSVTANDQYSYLLSYNAYLSSGEQKIIIKDIKDAYNSPVADDTLTFAVVPIATTDEFYVSAFQIIDAYKIKITFNLPVDSSSALNVNNYNFKPENKVSSVTIDNSDPKTVYLDLKGNKPVGAIGREYVLKINNVYSNVSSGNILIKAGAGSYIVLSTYAKDLANVYVYPNPTKESTEKITFANLPQKAKITIWSIDGKLINEIAETDGNGGFDYDLKDLNGNKISSGVYIFRVVVLDNLNNEGEEKLGKFAVVR